MISFDHRRAGGEGRGQDGKFLTKCLEIKWFLPDCEVSKEGLPPESCAMRSTLFPGLMPHSSFWL